MGGGGRGTFGVTGTNFGSHTRTHLFFLPPPGGKREGAKLWENEVSAGEEEEEEEGHTKFLFLTGHANCHPCAAKKTKRRNRKVRKMPLG